MPKRKYRKPVTVYTDAGRLNTVGYDSRIGREQATPKVKHFCLFLIFVNLIVFGQVVGHQFINFDDNKYIYENSMVQAGLTKASALWAFTTFTMGHWHPMTWLSYMLDYEMFGLRPGGYHFINLLLHIANTLLLFLLLRKLSNATWRSAVVAALFAIHPLHVEPVVWVSSRKDVLSAFFGILTVWAYVYYTKDTSSRKRYFLVFLFLFLGLMAKSILVTLPFALLLLDYWPIGRLRNASLKSMESMRTCAVRLVREKIPLFALAVVFSVIAFLAQSHGNPPEAQNQENAVKLLSTPRHLLPLAIPLNVYVTYIRKMSWPAGLAVHYPYAPPPLWSAVGAGVFLVCITVLVLRKAKQYPYLFVGWFWYLGTLFPVTRLLIADRYTYVPLIGLFVMVVWGVGDIVAGWRYRRVVMQIVMGIVISALAIGSWFQVRLWRDSETIFEHAIAVTTNNVVMHLNLGIALFQQGKLDEAASQFTEVIRLNPVIVDAHYYLGRVLSKQGKLDEANNQYSKMARIQFAEEHYNQGKELFKQGKLGEAASQYAEAVRLEPDFTKAREQLEELQRMPH